MDKIMNATTLKMELFLHFKLVSYGLSDERLLI